MPSYHTHVKVNLLLGLPLSIAALKYTATLRPEEMGAFCAAFLYGTFFLNPDLDLARNIKLFSVKGLLTLPFRPYSYLFRHRGISHLPIIGTLTRVLWLVLLFSLCSLSISFTPLFWFAIFGLVIADAIHILLDYVV